MTTQKSDTIIYTETDEAPALATRSLLPIVQAFAGAAGVEVQTRDISLAGRILAGFADLLPPHQRHPDALAELGAMTRDPMANIVKLPNISASVPQLKAAVAELRRQGYDALPDYPDEPSGEREREVRARYDRIKGSAVNPVLRQGNSDRRAPPAVKEHARRRPHPMGAWSADSRSHVASMDEGDFFASERSVRLDRDVRAAIRHTDAAGAVTVLKEDIALEAGDIVDAAFMSAKSLRAFLARQVDDARERGVLLSLHLKATMMKVSDPIIFGHAVRAYYAEVFERHGALLERLGVDPNNGMGDLHARLAALPEAERAAVEADIGACHERGPDLAMVDSERGVTNLHVPSDVIIDASMPAALRASGRMWGPDGRPRDMKAVIPDRCYAGVYQEVIDFCKAHGAFDPAAMGSVPNVGLMAQKAEEYGSHDKTFEIPAAGTVAVTDGKGGVLTEHAVEAGDIWRMCRTRDAAVRDWVGLAARRARAAGAPVVFWLDEARAHDAELIRKVRAGLAEPGAGGIDVRVMAPAAAARLSLERARDGLDTISATGNVLRDYLTDLFPILELGTSAKMLSIVPLMSGGGLFETGAGGSAPRHVRQFERENHLRWDSLGEFLALGASLAHLAEAAGNRRARVLADALDRATGEHLEADRSPSRRAGELDSRGSHFYLALYWARALAGQSDDARLARRFAPAAEALAAGEGAIVRELNAAQGAPVDIGGYYRPDPGLASAAMRPSAAFNRILASV